MSKAIESEEQLAARARLAHSKGFKYIEASKKTILNMCPNYSEDNYPGYFDFMNIKVYEKGRIPEIQKKEAMTLEEFNHGE